MFDESNWQDNKTALIQDKASAFTTLLCLTPTLTAGTVGIEKASGQCVTQWWTMSFLCFFCFFLPHIKLRIEDATPDFRGTSMRNYSGWKAKIENRLYSHFSLGWHRPKLHCRGMNVQKKMSLTGLAIILSSNLLSTCSLNEICHVDVAWVYLTEKGLWVYWGANFDKVSGAGILLQATWIPQKETISTAYL